MAFKTRKPLVTDFIASIILSEDEFEAIAIPSSTDPYFSIRSIRKDSGEVSGKRNISRWSEIFIYEHLAIIHSLTLKVASPRTCLQEAKEIPSKFPNENHWYISRA
jgi:hypothetical protein